MSLTGQYRPPFPGTIPPFPLTLGDLTRELAPLIQRSTTVLELAAMLDTLGYELHDLQRTFSIRDNFDLAARLVGYAGGSEVQVTRRSEQLDTQGPLSPFSTLVNAWMIWRRPDLWHRLARQPTSQPFAEDS